MCDIYLAKCEGCGLDLDIHIGDYSCPRSAITAWCPHCSKKAVEPTEGARRIEVEACWDKHGQCWTGLMRHTHRRKTKTAILFCTDPAGTDIDLN